MKLSIDHQTIYRYEDAVRHSIQYLRLTPKASARQQVFNWDLCLPHPARAQVDPYGNILHVLTMENPHDAIVITAKGEVEIDEQSECETAIESVLPYLRFTRLTQANEALHAFAYAATKARTHRNALIDLALALGEHMAYCPGATTVNSTAVEAFAGHAGVCQDHTHAFLACARSLKVPARYVSGYLYTDDETHLASHAWAEAWVDDAWYSFDVTNALMRPERHLKLAIGMDYLDACPVRGMRSGGGSELMHARVLVSSMAFQ